MLSSRRRGGVIIASNSCFFVGFVTYHLASGISNFPPPGVATMSRECRVWTFLVFGEAFPTVFTVMEEMLNS
jgi:hypothetical protein